MIDDGAADVAPTAAQVAGHRVSYDWLTGHRGGLYWVEASPLTGQDAVVRWTPEISECQVTGPAGVSVGSSLHAYGGMPYAVLPSGDVVVVDNESGQLAGRDVRTRGTAHVYGDLVWSDEGLLSIREGTRGDEIVAVEVSSGKVRVLLSTDGLLATPRPAPGRLAWVRWGPGVMPWDSSEVWVADRGPAAGSLANPVRVAGGRDESAFQPRWGFDGWLYFMSDRTGWWNLYRWRDGHTEAVAPMAAECATAPWESGYANYVLLNGGRIVMTVQRGPEQSLAVVSGTRTTLLASPYTSIKPFLARVGSRIAVIGASSTRQQEIAVISPDGSGRVDVIRRGREQPLGRLPAPELMRVPSGDGEVIAVYHPPATGGRPTPMIVRPHPGPTYHVALRLDGEVQFFTNRGFAVVDVDYRGSTGYGREFRKSLDGQWGRFDVDDCRNVARHLISAGLAAPGAVFISGASAGGYTALRAVGEEEPFALAVARSAIVDPHRWATTAPRFQRPHAVILAGDDSGVRADRVRRPVLLVHGVADEVAPIDDVMALAEALQNRGMLAGLLPLDGVGHYLSRSALATALDAELAAYLNVLKRAGLSLPG
ncbi:prolyl oligopeptidase family serine peptidase [Krasilnikovia sp. MM14-A1259]|uniref:S9 family peptidase n=1 Tax=Krasilnikovia sp. MM14-A1259 TaxID=3373539 RepID=UPI00380D4C7E